jgi:CYTH domain-containing protein
MNIEIERKFLVTRNAASMPGLPALLDTCTARKRMAQGYLHEGKPSTRVRLDLDNEIAHICIKAKRIKESAGKPEYEYQIPYADGLELLKLCGDRVLTKTRYEWIELATLQSPRCVFEIDVFTSDNLKGLVVAEVEQPENMTAEQFRTLTIPQWCHVELTGVKGWSNRRLVTQGIPKATKQVK